MSPAVCYRSRRSGAHLGNVGSMDKIVFGGLVVALLAAWRRVDRGRIWSVCALVAIVLMGLTHQLAFNVLADDAYISFRYAQNLADGQGLVFNSGERVEGYSNFLPTIILAGLHRYFSWEIPQTARIVGVLCVSLTIACVYGLGIVLTGETACGLMAAMLLAGSASLMAYGPSGLETPLFSLLVLGIIFLSVRRRWALAGVLISLSAMTRPEGCLLIVPCLVSILGTKGNGRDRLRAISQLLASVVVILAPWTLWRVWYYGHFLPNPISAKEGMDPSFQLEAGSAYVVHYSIANIPILILLGIGLWAAFKRQGAHCLRGTDLFLSMTIVLILVFACAVGGDWMPGWRFIAPATPPLCLLIVSLWGKHLLRHREIVERQAVLGGLTAAAVIAYLGIISFKMTGSIGWMPAWEARTVLVACGAAVIPTGLWWHYLARSNSSDKRQMAFGGYLVATIILFGTSFLHPNLLPRFRVWEQQVSGLSDIGQWLSHALPSGTWVAVFANGALSYYDKLPTIDVLGLTDEYIARLGSKDKTGWPGHIAHDYDYVASRRPAVVILSGQGFELAPEANNVMPEFQEAYRAVSFRFVRSDNPLGQYVNVWLLRSKEDDLIRELSSVSGVQLVTR